MRYFAAFGAALVFFGRHGTIAAAASIGLGLAVPGLAGLIKPLLGPTIVAMLVLAFLRVEPAALGRYFTRPGLIAAASLWLMLIMPAMLGALFVAVGVDRLMPGLYFMLVLQMTAPGLMSSPAIAALLGLDVALTLASLIVSMAVTPLTASLFSLVFLGTALAAPFAFALRLLLYIAGSALAAAIIRKLCGRAFIERQRNAIDGLSVLAFSLFAVAAMDGVTAHFIADPLLVSALTLLAFALALATLVLTALVFLPAGRARAFAIGLITANRNIGIMLAAVGFSAPDLAWLYFALAQFPIYLMPHLLRPLARRLNRDAPAPG